ncbi:hypothetical protein JCM19235_1303 [Vibrio maritimus]|uniref:Uncharacterized protein n=1 Tax=Vibrio maritimus TaxID=990268 RepID=A0A090SUL9_9VIBR|nr:hypothetical protein JCM19235_1303 [Vibrio maritimus]
MTGSLIFQDELDRKAYTAIEELMDHVESGALSPSSARLSLSLIQTAMSGLVSDDKEYLAMLTSADEVLEAMPTPTLRVDHVYKRDGAEPYLLRLTDCHLVAYKGTKKHSERHYELPSQAFKHLLALHRQLIKLGYTNK